MPQGSAVEAAVRCGGWGRVGLPKLRSAKSRRSFEGLPPFDGPPPLEGLTSSSLQRQNKSVLLTEDWSKVTLF